MDQLYYESKVTVIFKAFIWVFFLGIFGIVSFKWTEKHYKKTGYEDQLDFISDYIRVRKDKLLGKILDHAEAQKHEYYVGIVNTTPELQEI